MIARRSTRNMPRSGVLNGLMGQASHSSLVQRRALECLAMGMIGDGALAFIDPIRHVELWQDGPRFWRRMVQPFADRPELTRWLGAAEFALGYWLAARQTP